MTQLMHTELGKKNCRALVGKKIEQQRKEVMIKQRSMIIVSVAFQENLAKLFFSPHFSSNLGKTRNREKKLKQSYLEELTY